MKVSLQWLNKYIELPGDVRELASLLTNCGLEVESIEFQEDELRNFIVGKVVTCEKHPKADKLTICTVDIGESVERVICGAPNVAADQKIIFAKVGAVVPREKFTIEKKKIREVESSGMICSSYELNIDNDHSGILVLSDNAIVGQSAAEYFGKTDVVFEIGITPNRVDALSHIGVARDIAALLNLPLSLPDLETQIDQNISHNFVQIVDSDLCSRYSSVIIKGITVQESPEWLKKNLEAIGLRPINNIVDITNFVMYEIGHPMHAFDLDTLDQGRIIVRRSTADEKFVTLDGKERILDENVLLICDANKPVAIAGVMGGANSEITTETKNILLESAYFNPSSIRRTSKKLGLTSDSSFRFERGADPNITVWALRRAVQIILEIAGGAVTGFCDVYPEPIAKRVVKLRPERVDKILGIHIEVDRIEKILTVLGVEISRDHEQNVCSVPTNRPDLEREIDLIEEIARIYGYDKIPTPSDFKVHVGGFYDDDSFFDEVRTRCIGLGLYETQSPSLIELKKANLFDADKVVSVLNPVNAERPALRPSIVPSLLDTIDFNIRNGNTDLRLFEIGTIFSKHNNHNVKPNSESQKFKEEIVLGIAFTGKCDEKTWYEPERSYDIYDMKGLCESLFELLHLDNFTFICYDTLETLSDLGLSIEIEGTNVGHILEIAKETSDIFSVKQNVFIAELYLSRIKLYQNKAQVFKQIIRFPLVTRELAFIVEKKINAQDIIDHIKKLQVPYLQSVHVIDLFESDTFNGDKKSLAFSFSMQSPDKTLTDYEINDSITKIVESLSKRYNGVLRT